MRDLFLLCFLASAIRVTTSFQWTSSSVFPNGTTIPTCSGQDVTLPWAYTSEQEEHLTNVEWHYTPPGGDQVILATQVMGSFFAAPDTRQHFQYVPNAGLRLTNVTKADSGTYSVMVNLNLHGTVLEERQQVELQVTDAPFTADAQLHVTMSPDAVYDPSTKDFNVRLSCGDLTPIWEDQVSVVWRTPSNRTLPSTSHQNGQFVLVVPNPVESGQYTCSIADTPATRACVDSASPLRAGASVSVDGVTVQLAVMGAKLAAQQAQLQSQQAKNAEMETRLHVLQATEEALVQETLHYKQLAEAAAASAAALRTQLQSAAAQVFFHATPNGAKHFGDPLLNGTSPILFDHVESNIGGGYNGQTGYFTAPVSGVYLFIVTVTRADATGDIQVTLHVDGSSGADVYGAHDLSGSGQVAVHLTKGQRAWVTAVPQAGNREVLAGSPQSSFTGVLIQPDI